MKIIIDEYKREIQKIKMELSEQIEENVRLKGFKQMVMQKPQDFDNDRSFENDTRINLFDEERLEFKALQNRIKEAISEYNKANLYHPKNIKILLGLGTAYFLNKQNSKGIKAFEMVLKIEPSNHSIYKTLKSLNIKILKR